jgi:hypothetical protein
MLVLKIKNYLPLEIQTIRKMKFRKLLNTSNYIENINKSPLLELSRAS